MRHYRTSLLLASLVAACAGQSQKPAGPALPPVGQSHETPPAAEAPTTSTAPGAPTGATVDAKPDTPAGADAAHRQPSRPSLLQADGETLAGGR